MTNLMRLRNVEKEEVDHRPPGRLWANTDYQGEPREFANRVLDDLLRQRREKMSRPHLRMNYSFPSHSSSTMLHFEISDI